MNLVDSEAVIITLTYHSVRVRATLPYVSEPLKKLKCN